VRTEHAWRTMAAVRWSDARQGVCVRAMAVALLAIALVTGGSGCSIVFAKGPPERIEPHERPRCTHSYALPVVDGIIAALQVVRVLYALSLHDEDYKNLPLNRQADIGIGAGLATLFIVSTAVGGSRVGDCLELSEKVGTGRGPAPHSVNPFTGRPRQAPDDEDKPDVERARAAAAAADAKAAGEAAGRSTKPPAPSP